LAKGDTIYLSKAFMIFQGFSTNIQDPRYKPMANDISVSAVMDIYTLEGKINSVNPIYYIRNQAVNFIDDTTAASVGAVVRLGGIVTEEDKANIQIKEIEQHKRWIVLKAIQFPHINLVWAGTILMVLGFLLSMWRSNAKKSKNVIEN
jgi:cytochrome c-type biogenesis protein CcmF